MGHDNIRTVIMPKTDLARWLAQLDQTAREYVKRRLGNLVLLLDIKVRIGIIHALAHCWVPQTATFLLGKHELTPTLEEYSELVGKSLDSPLIHPFLGKDASVVLAEFLRVEISVIRKILKANYGNCPFSFLTDCFNKADSLQRGKVFILAFFGLIVFPHHKNSVHPSMAHFAQQVCQEKKFIVALLAETFISLNKCRRDGAKVLRAPAELLQIWFLSHIKECRGLVSVDELRNFAPPMVIFKNKQKKCPDYHFSEWLKLMRDPTAKSLQWHASWFQGKVARLTSGEAGPVPLLGFTGTAEYYPPRVVRQFGCVQKMPPPLPSEQVHLNFEDLITEHERTVITTCYLWAACHPTKLSFPRKPLEPAEEAYQSTKEYRLKHSIPEAWRPKLPDVTPARYCNNELRRMLADAYDEVKTARKALKRAKKEAGPSKRPRK